MKFPVSNELLLLSTLLISIFFYCFALVPGENYVEFLHMNWIRRKKEAKHRNINASKTQCKH